MTHIIIPISVIEKRIKELEKAQLKAQEENDLNGAFQIDIEMETINELVLKGKKMDLKEKKWEELKPLAEKVMHKRFLETIQGGETHGVEVGYSIAINELL